MSMDMGVLMGMIILVMVIGIAGSTAAILGGVYVVRRLVFAIKGEPYIPMLQSNKKRPYLHLDAETGSTPDDIERVLRKYTGVDVVGVYAQSGLRALEGEQHKSASFSAVLDSKFAKGSLSWDKFASAASGTHDAIVSNCAKLANLVQTFDHADYRSVERTMRRAPWKQGALPSATDAQKHQLYQNSLSNMNCLVSANEALLLELDKLTAELSKLDNIDSTESSTRMLEEIRTLIDETKYYTQN